MKSDATLSKIDTLDGKYDGNAPNLSSAETMTTISHSIGLAMEAAILNQSRDHPSSQANLKNALAALLGKKSN